MCIIIVKPYGKTIPQNHLMQAFNNNSDGAGVAYTTGDGITIKKGYFSWDKFSRKCLKYNRPEVSAVFHFRIATHGGTTAGLCHPFPITTDDGDMQKQKLTRLEYAVAHNGIFRLDGLIIPTGDSDTTAFIKSHLHPIYTARRSVLDSGGDIENFDAIIESLTHGSKLAVLHNNGYAKRYGKGWINEDGCFYSNNTFKARQYYHHNWLYNDRVFNSGWSLSTATPTTTTPTATKKPAQCSEDDTGYFGGCYWWNGERVTKGEYDALQQEARQQQIDAEWLEKLKR